MRSVSHSGSADKYQQNYLFRHQQMNQGPYQHGSHSTYDEQLQNLNSMVANLFSELARLSESNEQILLVNARHSFENDALTLQVKTAGLSDYGNQ
jgi:dihydroxyacetone kinase